MSDDDKRFVSMVLYFTIDKGDPTRYSGWDEARCVLLMPDFYAAWQATLAAQAKLTRIVNSYQGLSCS